MGQLRGQTQMVIASLLNFLGVAIAIYLFCNFRVERLPDKDIPARAKLPADTNTRALYYAFMLSGAASLGLEIVWNRLAYMSLVHTIYTFAIVLSVYLAAYAAGALLSGIWLRTHRPRRNTIAVLQLCSLVSAMGGFTAFAYGLHYSAFKGFLGNQSSALLVVLIYVFLPMFFMGIAMPQVVHLLSNDPRRLGRDTSHALMLNNIGSIIAIVVVGFVLIPLTNLYVVSLFCIFLQFGSVVLMLDPNRSRRSRAIHYTLMVTVLVVGLWVYPRAPYETWKRSSSPGVVPLWFTEDESGLWGVYYRKGDKKSFYRLYLNNYYKNYLVDPAEGSIEADFLVSATVKPLIRSAYSIGLGFALEAHELLRLPEVERFDTAEISPGAIILAKRVWSRLGGSPFKDTRFRVLQDDGRILLEHLPGTYDLVYSGTNRSYYPGSTNLFSVEYFEMIKGKLNK